MLRDLSALVPLIPLVMLACGGSGGDDDGETTSPVDTGPTEVDTGSVSGPGDTGDTGDGTSGATGEPPPYDVWGDYSVGTEQVDVDGPDGLTLTAQVWYPSDDEQGDPVNYGLFEGLASEDLSADCSQTRPVLAFSHGNGGIRYQSPFFTEHLASHGYVVVAVDHTDNTLLDLDFGQISQVALRRPADIAAAFDALPLIDTVADCIDPADGYAVAGHSFGGYTALAAAGAEVNDPVNGGEVFLGDDRVWASIGLAPWDGFGAITDGTQYIDVPTLILTGRRDQITPLLQVRGLWSPLEVEPRYFGIFERAGHYSFSPIACLLETDDGCAPDDIAPEEFEPLVMQATMAFLESVRLDPALIERLPEESDELEWD